MSSYISTWSAKLDTNIVDSRLAGVFDWKGVSFSVNLEKGVLVSSGFTKFLKYCLSAYTLESVVNIIIIFIIIYKIIT